MRIATGRNEGSGGVRNAVPGERLGPRGIAREDRTCWVCGQGTVEDLQHFLLECPDYHDVKQPLSQCLHRRTPRRLPFGVTNPIRGYLRLSVLCLLSANACCETDAAVRVVSGGFGYGLCASGSLLHPRNYKSHSAVCVSLGHVIEKPGAPPPLAQPSGHQT